MILATRHAGNRELRYFGADTSRPQFGSWTGRWSWAGETVTGDSASGLAAVGRAVRLVSGLVASLPIGVYSGRKGDKREQPSTDQARLFANPAAGVSDYDWRYDVASSLEIDENAYLLKAKDKRGVVREMYPVPCKYVAAWLNQSGEKVFEVQTADGIAKLGAKDVLHIRGQTLGGGPFGVSRIEQHRDPIGAMQAAQKFEGSYFRNHARPDLALQFPGGVSQEQAREWRDFWSAQYGGAANAGQAIPLGAGATIVPIPSVNWRDAQFVESKAMSVEEVGRIMDVDPVLLGASKDQNTDVQASLELFLRVQFIPRLRRIERGFRADTDLFMVDDDLYPLFEVSEMIFADALTRAQVQHQQIQDGTLLVDEARAELGRDELPDGMGKIPQITPVGGAPNPMQPAMQPEMEDENRQMRESGVVSVPSIELRVEQDMEPLSRELGFAMANIADAFSKFTSVAEIMQQQTAQLEQRRERRETEISKKTAGLAEAQLEALRQAVSQPAPPAPIVNVNVEPTPVTVENTVNVTPVPVELTLVDSTEPTDLEVNFDRNHNGQIQSARITES